jgi:hypothetical protein
MQKAGRRLDNWYNAVDDGHSVNDIFTEDVTIIRHVTDSRTGECTTVCLVMADLARQHPDTFGTRKKHCLSELHDAAHCVTYVQSYEISVDESQRTWRQSSIRIRVYDPNQDYKLSLGIIFFSERDLMENRVLHGYSTGSTDAATLTAAAGPVKCEAGRKSAAPPLNFGLGRNLVAALCPGQQESDCGTSKQGQVAHLPPPIATTGQGTPENAHVPGKRSASPVLDAYPASKKERSQQVAG